MTTRRKMENINLYPVLDLENADDEYTILRQMQPCYLATFFYYSVLTVVFVYFDYYSYSGSVYLLPAVLLHCLLECCKCGLFYGAAKCEAKLFDLKFPLAFGTGFFIFAVASVVLGADIWLKMEETLMFSFVITSLVMFPAYLYAKEEGVQFFKSGSLITSSNVLQNSMVTVAKYTLAAAWCGACVIPLDWDRPWQQWPNSCVISAMLGFSLGHLMCYYDTLDHLERYSGMNGYEMRRESSND